MTTQLMEIQALAAKQGVEVIVSSGPPPKSTEQMLVEMQESLRISVLAAEQDQCCEGFNQPYKKNNEPFYMGLKKKRRDRETHYRK